ncbi:MAG TPA: hypothetical protein PLL90_07565 [Bacteroidales bacterium]|nr:hypothetical protein [Bacteroidales bacterium]
MAKALNASCKKDEGIDDITWYLNGAMNPDGSFTVIAKTVLELRKIIFGAAVTTSQMPDKQGY